MAWRVLITVCLAALALAGAALADTTTGVTTTTTAALTTAPLTAPLTTPLTGPAPTTTTTGLTTTHVTTTTSTTVATTTRPVTSTAATSTAQTTTTQSLATSSAATTLVVTGHGWGHGMGMAQWGADGYAQHGWSYTRILTHYYQRTTIAPAPSPTVRVLLLDGARKVTLVATSAWTAKDAVGATVSLAAGKLVVPASLVVHGKKLASPVSFSASAPLEVGGRHYRGRLVLVSNGKKLQVVNAVGLESYVKGVVGMEMPSSWPAAALETQAVAARSYALAELESKVTVSAFDLYADTRSQVYGGVEGESPPVTAAVKATSKQVVLYDGKVATTYFSSSSGGRTVSMQEATGRAVPYLVSVADPYDTLSPYHDWGPVLFDARKVGRLLHADGDLLDLQLTPGVSGHVQSVSVVGTNGMSTVTGNAVRSLLGLRSSWFAVGWLSLEKPTDPPATGTAVTLTGTARGVPGPISLEGKTGTGPWQPVATVTPDTSGAFSVTVQPVATTRYRLATGSIRAAVVTVP